MKWLAWTIALALIAGCVSVVVQIGEKNAADREFDVGIERDKDKEQSP